MRHIALFVPVIGVLVGLGMSLSWILENSDPLPVFGTVPEFVMQDSDERRFAFSDTSGSVRVISFFFARCPDICPALNGELASVYRKYKTDSRVHFVSISVDPENDTPEVLSRYAEKFAADTSNWHFLTGELEQVQKLLVDLKLREDSLPAQHTTRVVLVDGKGQIRGYFLGADKEAFQDLQKAIDRLT